MLSPRIAGLTSLKMPITVNKKETNGYAETLLSRIK
jgi:hypothetical protein